VPPWGLTASVREIGNVPPSAAFSTARMGKKTLPRYCPGLFGAYNMLRNKCILRMTTLQEVDCVSHEADRVLQAYSANRSKFPAEELLQFAGRWIAWSPEATEVIASAADRETLRSCIREAGYDPQHCVAERIPQAGTA
jgi:hypothetical protein